MSETMEYTQNPDALTDGLPRSEEEQQYGDPETGGDLLEEPNERKVAERIVKFWTDQDTLMQQRLVQWKVNALRRRGVPNVRARVGRDGTWHVWMAPNVHGADTVPAFRKAADLCRKLVSFLWADPPAPEAVPPSGDDDDVDAAEFATRALEDVQSESTLDDAGKGRRAFDRGCTHGSGFVWYRVMPHAGGRVPVRVRAGRDNNGRRAATMDEAINDPLTGLPWPEFESRFVTRDGSITDDEAAAATRWAPGLTGTVLDGRQVRMRPATTEDLRSATEVLVHEFVAWGDLLEEHEELASLTDEDREAVKGWRPPRHSEIVPGAVALALEHATGKDALVSRLHYYRETCPQYPDGAHIVVVGGRAIVTRGGWSRTVKSQKKRLLLPLTQYGQFSEGEDNPYLVGLMQIIGPAEEIRNAIWAALLDYIDKVRNRRIFLPSTGGVSAKQLNNPGYKILPMTERGEPKYEEIPPFGGEHLVAMDKVDQGMDNASGLQQTGQGIEGKGVESGRHAYAILSQVHTVLSELAQNIERAYLRGCRIQMQLIQAFYDVEQRVKWTGDDGEYKERAWSGSDFESTEDVRLRPGTNSGLSPAAKEAQAKEYQQLGLMQPHEVREVIRKNVGGRLGLQDDRQLARIRRQLDAWKAGPPEGWEPPQAPVAPATDPATGLPIPGAPPVPLGPPPPDPTLASIFMPAPSDELPDVARVRLHEIKQLMATKVYFRHPPEWREALAQEFARMKAVVFPPAQVAPPTPAGPAGAEPPPPSTPPGGIMPEPGM